MGKKELRHSNPAPWNRTSILWVGLLLLTIGSWVYLVALYWVERPVFSLFASAVVGLLAIVLPLFIGPEQTAALANSWSKKRKSWWLVWLFLAVSILIWLTAGRARIISLQCGLLGCPEDGTFHIGVDEWESLPPTLDITIPSRQILLEKLSCADGLNVSNLDHDTDDNIRQTLDLLIRGRTIVSEQGLTIRTRLVHPESKEMIDQKSVTANQVNPQDDARDYDILVSHQELAKEILLSINRQIDAVEIERIGQIPTTNQDAWLKNNQAAVTFMASQDYSVAMHLLREAIALDPNYASAYNNLGRMLREQDDLDGAIIHYKRAAELLPCNPLYHFNLGDAYIDQEKYPAAIAAFGEALNRKPDYVLAINGLGYVYLLERELEKAAEYFNRGLELEPENAHLNKNLGRVYYEQEKFEEAVRVLETAISQSNETMSEAFFYAASAYEKIGDAVQACLLLEQYIPMSEKNLGQEEERAVQANALRGIWACGE